MPWAATWNSRRPAFPRKLTLEKLRIAVDVANGAAYKSTPCILRELGADVLHVPRHSPDGTNINRDCGSTHPRGDPACSSGRPVRRSASPMTATPIACCSATSTGDLVDGDEVMAIAAREFLRQGRLAGKILSRRP